MEPEIDNRFRNVEDDVARLERTVAGLTEWRHQIEVRNAVTDAKAIITAQAEARRTRLVIWIAGTIATLVTSAVPIVVARL